MRSIHLFVSITVQGLSVASIQWILFSTKHFEFTIEILLRQHIDVIQSYRPRRQLIHYFEFVSIFKFYKQLLAFESTRLYFSATCLHTVCLSPSYHFSFFFLFSSPIVRDVFKNMSVLRACVLVQRNHKKYLRTIVCNMTFVHKLSSCMCNITLFINYGDIFQFQIFNSCYSLSGSRLDRCSDHCAPVFLFSYSTGFVCEHVGTTPECTSSVSLSSATCMQKITQALDAESEAQRHGRSPLIAVVDFFLYHKRGFVQFSSVRIPSKHRRTKREVRTEKTKTRFFYCVFQIGQVVTLLHSSFKCIKVDQSSTWQGQISDFSLIIGDRCFSSAQADADRWFNRQRSIRRAPFMHDCKCFDSERAELQHKQEKRRSHVEVVAENLKRWQPQWCNQTSRLS